MAQIQRETPVAKDGTWAIDALSEWTSGTFRCMVVSGTKEFN